MCVKLACTLSTGHPWLLVTGILDSQYAWSHAFPNHLHFSLSVFIIFRLPNKLRNLLTFIYSFKLLVYYWVKALVTLLYTINWVFAPCIATFRCQWLLIHILTLLNDFCSLLTCLIFFFPFAPPITPTYLMSRSAAV